MDSRRTSCQSIATLTSSWDTNSAWSMSFELCWRREDISDSAASLRFPLGLFRATDNGYTSACAWRVPEGGGGGGLGRGEGDI